MGKGRLCLQQVQGGNCFSLWGICFIFNGVSSGNETVIFLSFFFFFWGGGGGGGEGGAFFCNTQCKFYSYNLHKYSASIKKKDHDNCNILLPFVLNILYYIFYDLQT